MKICSVADVHIPHVNVGRITPDADVLTVSGDLTSRGSLDNLRLFRAWLDQQPQKHKIIIAGNHDFCLDPDFVPGSYLNSALALLQGEGIHYLQDSSVTIDGVKFYGAPWQPWFGGMAFNLARGEPIAAKWALIPDDVDVLLTHGPAYGYGDRTSDGFRAGCQDLYKAIVAKKPRYALCGHIHEDTGQWDLNGSKLVNCSIGYPVGDEPADIQRNPYLFGIEPRK